MPKRKKKLRKVRWWAVKEKKKKTVKEQGLL
jgi:hypothetical protein